MTAVSDSLAVAPAAPALSLSGESERGGALLWLVAAITLGVGIALIDNLPVGVMWDDGMYVILAQALATGQGYHWINLPGAPAATHFPPGYPALLAAFWWMGSSLAMRVVLFKLLNACFLASTAVLATRFLREHWTVRPAPAALFALASTLGIPMLSLTVVVMSEPFFLTLLLLALPLADRVLQRPDRTDGRVVGVGALAALATLVRSHGIALVVAIPWLLLRRGRKRDAALSLGTSLLLLAPWQLWVAIHGAAVPDVLSGSYGSYAGWFASGLRSQGAALVARAASRNVSALLGMLATLVAPGMLVSIRITALVTLAVLAIVGARALRRGSSATALFLALYLAIVLVWPFPPARFVWGVWPLVVLVPFLGARELLLWRPTLRAHRAARGTILVCATLLVLGHLTYTARGVRGHWWSSIPRQSAQQLRPLVLWAAEHTSPRAVLGVESESAVFLYAGRRAVPIQTFAAAEYLERRTPSENAAAMRQILAAYPVSAIAVSGPVTRDAARLLATEQPPELVVRDTFPGGVVLVPRSR